MFIHLSLNGHEFLHLLAIIDNAAINTGVQISVEVHTFNYFGYIIDESYSNSV